MGHAFAERRMARVYRQAAVIPYRVRAERVEIALVTSQSGKRWIVPKGSLDDGEDAVDAAIRETQEEAGLIGELVERPIGRYRYTKQNDWYHVDVYLMRVTAVLDSWVEDAYRRRRFMPVEDALTLLHPVLHEFVHEAARLARAQGRRSSDGNGRSQPPWASYGP
jgi:8-oxo-dGTP pyrophosphatase MutT (NUDIX family)